MKTQKIFAVGDIHGCLYKLTKLVSIIPWQRSADVLLFIGDYIDRGPDSKEVVDYVIRLQAEYENIVCLVGNHERSFLDYLKNRRNEDLYFFNGGGPTLVSYGYTDLPPQGEIEIPESHLLFYHSLLPYYETEDYIFVHAGLRPGIPLERQSIEDLTWIRHEFIGSAYDFGKIVVFGHTPLARPFFDSHKIGIDTGAVYGGALTCLELPTMNIYQV